MSKPHTNPLTLTLYDSLHRLAVRAGRVEICVTIKNENVSAKLNSVQMNMIVETAKLKRLEMVMIMTMQTW